MTDVSPVRVVADEVLVLEEDREAVLSDLRRGTLDYVEVELRAYEPHCVVTGIRLALGGVFFGPDVAHIMSHRYGGPGVVDADGMALTPTLLGGSPLPWPRVEEAHGL